ncbi:MAG TPA: hypothetical protein VEL47_03965, partial [Myxococcota bacterium]|nr:hypothetical protein [Myxococcota bacterium]
LKEKVFLALSKLDFSDREPKAAGNAGIMLSNLCVMAYIVSNPSHQMHLSTAYNAALVVLQKRAKKNFTLNEVADIIGALSWSVSDLEKNSFVISARKVFDLQNSATIIN